jgi:hypothetical protein
VCKHGESDSLTKGQYYGRVDDGDNESVLLFRDSLLDEICRMEEDNKSISTVFIPQFQAGNESYGEIMGQNCEGNEDEEDNYRDKDAEAIEGIIARHNVI